MEDHHRAPLSDAGRLNSAWRLLLALSAVLIAAGGPLHPRGSMVEMLAHPDWVRSHLLMLSGFVVLLVCLGVYRRTLAVDSGSNRWAGIAILGTILQVVEMGLHTAAVVDATNLAAGEATPVLSLHLGASILFYPLFAVAMIGLLVVASRERTLGSVRYVWLGVLGLVAHGIAPLLVVALGIEQARILFPMFMLFAIWALLAAALTPKATRSYVAEDAAA